VRPSFSEHGGATRRSTLSRASAHTTLEHDRRPNHGQREPTTAHLLGARACPGGGDVGKVRRLVPDHTSQSARVWVERGGQACPTDHATESASRQDDVRCQYGIALRQRSADRNPREETEDFQSWTRVLIVCVLIGTAASRCFPEGRRCRFSSDSMSPQDQIRWSLALPMHPQQRERVTQDSASQARLPRLHGLCQAV
jgi:hypothetical protein